jgi:hypothetical protein
MILECIHSNIKIIHNIRSLLIASRICDISAEVASEDGRRIQHTRLYDRGWILGYFLVYSSSLHQLHWLQALGCKHKAELQGPEIIGTNYIFHHFMLVKHFGLVCIREDVEKYVKFDTVMNNREVFSVCTLHGRK